MATVKSKRNVKIFVLYLMQNVNYPIDYVTINDMVMQTDYIQYFEFAESFYEMVDTGLIEEVCQTEDGDPMYVVTAQGKLVATELKSEILPSILDKSLECALRYLNFKKRGVTVKTQINKLDDNNYELICILKEKDEEIMKTSVILDSLNRAERMENNFHDHPEVVYKGMLSLLSGNINFIFN